MQVEITAESVRLNGRNEPRGKIVDIPGDLAKAWFRLNLAKPAIEKKPKPKEVKPPMIQAPVTKPMSAPIVKGGETDESTHIPATNNPANRRTRGPGRPKKASPPGRAG